jgi:hypothetical protein
LFTVNLKVAHWLSAKDSLSNEYFIEASGILSGHITELSNTILESDNFSEIWTRGLL